MRIDLALKYLCLAKSRSAVKSMCEKNVLWVNDRPAKPSSTLHVEDHVRIATSSWTLTISLQRRWVQVTSEKPFSDEGLPTRWTLLSKLF